TTDTEYPVDIIVFATGFDAMTGPMLRMGITGRDGISLAKAWEAGPRTYLGLQIPGFPNLFSVTGPGSPSVLCNMPVAIEQHGEWITDCITHMRQHGLERIEATTRWQWASGWRKSIWPPTPRVTAGDEFLVPRRQRARQAPGVHALCRRDGAISADLQRY